jgi:6-phosphogluconolactonase/glucosamine-6-phosphate isomerase/deaminase
LIKTFTNKRTVYQQIISIINKNKIPFIISGGNTIKSIFKYLNQKINNIILLSDERLVKKTSNLRNDLFFKNLIKKKYISKKNFFSYDSSNLSSKNLAKINKQIKNIHFKLAILSLGSNGHFASIFQLENKNDNYHYVDNSPKFPKSRVTINIKKIKKCNKIIFIASIKNKKKEIKNFYKNRLIRFLGYKKVDLYIY